MMKRTAEWFEKRLYSFFICKYADCESAEFYIPPKKNQYVFDLPDRKQRIVLTCHDDGKMEEKILQYTSGGLESSSKRIQTAEAKSRDYSTLLEKSGNKAGSNSPLTIMTTLYEVMSEEKNKSVLRTPSNALKPSWKGDTYGFKRIPKA